MLDLPTIKKSKSNVSLIDSAIAFLTGHDGEEVINIFSKYMGIEKKADDLGRTLLHIAASQGKDKVVEWLYHKGANLLAVDRESNWTALHRAAFYGYLQTIILLIQLGSETSRTGKWGRESNLERFLTARDSEGHTFLDIMIADKQGNKTFMGGQTETYTWGSNLNNILGHEKSQPINAPEEVDCFRRMSMKMTMVSVGTYHTIFLSQSGEVYTCGHGVGGRLGHGDEKSLLTPKLVSALAREKCKWVSASHNQSLFVSRNDIIYGCGINSHNLLCQNNAAEKVLNPKPLEAKSLKGAIVEKVWGLRCHVVIQTSTALYSHGLNAGQLGHPKVDSERWIPHPRCISKLCNVNKVAASNAATVATTLEGHVYVLQEYTCRKIFSSRSVNEICVSGGRLDDAVVSDWRRDGSHGASTGSTPPAQGPFTEGRDLIVALLCESGRILVWSDRGKCLRQLVFSPRRTKARVMSLSRHSNVLAVISDEGQLWVGNIPGQIPACQMESKSPAAIRSHRGLNSFDRPMKVQEFVDVTLSRVTGIHNAETVTVDDRGTNFALVAICPTTRPQKDSCDQKLNNHPKCTDPSTATPNQTSQTCHGFHSLGTVSKCTAQTKIDKEPFTIRNRSVDIVLESTEGSKFACTRDFLSSKIPYFESMFREYNWECSSHRGWSESTQEGKLIKMDMTTPALAIFLNHVYSGCLHSCNPAELENSSIMCECLVAADQYFVDDFKEVVEYQLSKLLTLKNVVRIACLSIDVRAEMLESIATKFICTNVPCLVESGAFNNADPGVLTRITASYRSFANKDAYRTITSYDPLPFPAADPSNAAHQKKKRRSKVKPARDFNKDDSDDVLPPSQASPVSTQPFSISQQTLTTLATTTSVVVEALTASNPNSPNVLSNDGTQAGSEDIDCTKSSLASTNNKGPPKKMSQKSRKEAERLHRLQQKENMKNVGDGAAVPVVRTSTASVANPWKVTNAGDNNDTRQATPPTPTTPSFKDIMKLDMMSESRASNVLETKSSSQTNKKNNECNSDRMTSSFGLVVTNNKNKKQQNDQQLAEPIIVASSPTSPPPNVWGRRDSAPLQGAEKVVESANDRAAFSSILKEEEMGVEASIRVTNKSLHLVQLEEKAMEELRVHYGASNPDEYVVVARAPSNLSKPLWRATQRQTKFSV